MVDVLQSGKSDAQRISDRLKPSAGSPDTASTQVTTGTGPTRVVHTIHRGSQQSQHGPVNPGEGDITGHNRGSLKNRLP
jgi:hypothetical protein